jgi:uroporphyrinogen-III synthase
VLILRPEPGAAVSAGRARALGLDPVVAPLFAVRPLTWDPPPGPFDALLLTSANGARHAGPGLAAYAGLPCFAVGEATAEAAAEAGIAQVRAGASDGVAAVEEMARAGVRRALHLCGREHLALSHRDILFERCAVYAAEATERLPKAATEALAEALVLLHSPRAASLFASFVEQRQAVRIAAISAAAAEAAGTGWAEVHAAPAPRDEALLELAARLCQTGARQERD